MLFAYLHKRLFVMFNVCGGDLSFQYYHCEHGDIHMHVALLCNIAMLPMVVVVDHEPSKKLLFFSVHGKFPGNYHHSTVSYPNITCFIVIAPLSGRFVEKQRNILRSISIILLDLTAQENRSAQLQRNKGNVLDRKRCYYDIFMKICRARRKNEMCSIALGLW